MWPIAAVLPLLPVLYVASVGPVVWLDDRDLLRGPAREAAVAFYSPLTWLADVRRGVLGDCLEHYVELWR